MNTKGIRCTCTVCVEREFWAIVRASYPLTNVRQASVVERILRYGY